MAKWQTRNVEVVVPQGIWVQVPFSAYQENGTFFDGETHGSSNNNGVAGSNTGDAFSFSQHLMDESAALFLTSPDGATVLERAAVLPGDKSARVLALRRGNAVAPNIAALAAEIVTARERGGAARFSRTPTNCFLPATP